MRVTPSTSVAEYSNVWSFTIPVTENLPLYPVSSNPPVLVVLLTLKILTKLPMFSWCGISAVTVTTASEDDKLFFEKVEKTLNIQTLDRDLVAKGGPVALHDDTLTGTAEKPNTASSARVSGQIIYQSPNVFTITTPSTLSDSSKALHRDAAPAASLTKISDVNVKTVMGAQRLLSAVDGALRRVDAERGDLGATMNRMEHTIDNLSNIVVNTKISRSRMQDADMAAESIELTKGRILQQAATSMLSQANQSMQSVLELLQ